MLVMIVLAVHCVCDAIERFGVEFWICGAIALESSASVVDNADELLKNEIGPPS